MEAASPVPFLHNFAVWCMVSRSPLWMFWTYFKRALRRGSSSLLFQLIYCLAFILSGFLLIWWTLDDNASANRDMESELLHVEKALDKHLALESNLKAVLIEKGFLSEHKLISHVHLPVLLIACNRPSVKRTLDALIKHRTNVADLRPDDFPITVSHGCQDSPTAKVIASYGDAISVIHFEDSPSPPAINLTRHQLPYRSVAHHYKFALDYMFLTRNHSAVIVVEDDLDIAPDFFEYFAATLPLLETDRRLFCVSAWNDNGRPQLINTDRNDLVYRTDFFSGLGWMLLRDFWLEIRDGWPDVYWDEYLRKPKVHRNRACLRPELGRTTTFGRVGISRGQYFDKYLKSMYLNTVKYNFLRADLSYLWEPIYVHRWHVKVYKEAKSITVDELLLDRLPPIKLSPILRVTYITQKDYLQIARYLGVMEDVKSGVMRNAFRGVVPLTWKHRLLFIAPPMNWTAYPTDWV
ncbi:hypothetical protein EG68_03881 [Paragonimus skrjabini miyazakii]|uniref:Alpha-1,3-mannosyl-glycoprotein 2-beta-N-acetylglucosaminyltransferase n=1 Tax=Paragonimus skrjabini miyazakii TaxID=59628 RepID=A0A8S9YUE1_9TREM|nr:hypothetical protein EG68_03881 [Paragonimus skrjabini miyazakii]